MTLKNDYADFCEGYENNAPHLKNLAEIEKDLIAWKKLVQQKLYACLAIGAAISILLCPQFNVGISLAVYHSLHQLLNNSHFLCGVFCAFVYLVVMRGVMWALLHSSERRYLAFKPHRTALQIVALSYGGLMLISGFQSSWEHMLPLAYHIAWILSLFLGLVLTMRLGEMGLKQSRLTEV